MHAVTPALIVVAIFNACLWSGLLWQLWVLRHEFEIAARAPVIVGISGVGSLILLLATLAHWILLLESKGLPCYMMLFASYLGGECISVAVLGPSVFSLRESSRISRTLELRCRVRDLLHNTVCVKTLGTKVLTAVESIPGRV